MKKLILLLACLGPLLSNLSAQIVDSSKTTQIYYFQLFDEINPAAWRTTQKAIEEAKEMKADLILLHMNTYGGMLESADSIRTAILNCPIPVWVFIDNNAASAGALISIACDSIYMRRGASIGAATVVNQNAEALPDKYQSYMRSMMRATAEANGRNPDIAQAMVDPDVYIEGIIDSGKVLTFTTSEALANGYCEGQAETIEELFQNAHIVNYEIHKQEITAMDRVIGFLINPMISGLLIMIIIGGIYFEMQTPGIGFALFASVIAALLYFAPLYLEGLAEHWEILLFIGGLGLLALEVFVIPGFGVAGVGGIILVITGLTLSMVRNSGFSMPDGDYVPVLRSLAVVSMAIFLGLISSFWLGKRLITSSVFGRTMALTQENSSADGYIASDSSLKNVIGKKGIAHTYMRPAGIIEIEGNQYDACTRFGFIEKGEAIQVVDFEGAQLIVKKI